MIALRSNRNCSLVPSKSNLILYSTVPQSSFLLVIYDGKLLNKLFPRHHHNPQHPHRVTPFADHQRFQPEQFALHSNSLVQFINNNNTTQRDSDLSLLYGHQCGKGSIPTITCRCRYNYRFAIYLDMYSTTELFNAILLCLPLSRITIQELLLSTSLR